MRRSQYTKLMLFLLSMTCFALGMGAKLLYGVLRYDFLTKSSDVLLKLAIFIMSLIVIVWLLSNKIYRGLRYFLRYMIVKNTLEQQMIDAGFYISRGNVLELPQIRLEFRKGLESGVLRIKNNLKFDRKLDYVVMSSALWRYVVERHYISDDGNYHIYELIDGSVNYRIEFDSYDDFVKYNKRIPTYSLFLDARSVVKLQHTLLVGMTGSGKTYFLYCILLQFYNKQIPFEIYYADPKGSSLAVIGETVAPDRTAIGVDSIIEKLDEFVDMMRDRKEEIKTLLNTKLDADYSDFNKPAYVFLFDEYASFASVVASEDKKTRDKINALLSEIILQGRQLGFFLFVIAQKSDANIISTALRENLPLKLVLGQSEQQTIVTAFGAGIDIPNRHYKVGEGVFTEPVIAPEPKIVQCPYLNFDIMDAIKRATPGL